jgi:phosphonate transport system permease protein
MPAEPSSDFGMARTAGRSALAMAGGTGTAGATGSAGASAAGAPPSPSARPGGVASWSRFRYPQSLYKYAATLGTLALIAFSLDYLHIDIDRLPGMLGRMGEMLARRYFPPNINHILNADYLHTVVETLQMSYLATVLGIAAAIPLAWFAAYNMTPSRRVLYPVARLFIMACRSVHEMIWTILLVALLGFGMLPGALALTLFCIGFAGKLFSEAIEAIELGQVEAIRSAGGNALQVFVFAVLPQVRVAWTGITIYTWDVVFRAATVVGFFGAGGMGWYLRESVQRVASRDVAAILLSIIVVVVVSELFSAWLRKRIAQAIA